MTTTKYKCIKAKTYHFITGKIYECIDGEITDEYGNQWLNLLQLYSKFELGVEPTEGTFMWAVEQMKQGRHVSRPKWSIDRHFIGMNMPNDVIRWLNNINDATNQVDINLDKIEATDWEIYVEPNKTLYSKRNELTHLKSRYAESDIKEALREFLNYIHNGKSESDIKNKAKEIFGEELLK